MDFKIHYKYYLIDLLIKIGSLKSCKIIRDKTSGNSFGFGFAEYYDPTHATQAVNELNGMQIKDKQIKVLLLCIITVIIMKAYS